MKNKYSVKSFIYLSMLLVISCLSLDMKAQSAQDSSPQVPGAGFFTGGIASVVRMVTPVELNCGAAKVSFPAGVRTIWHSHAGGQFIVVTSGTAWYQEKGKPKRVIAQGEAIVCAPGVMHWHGASPDSPMSHTVATPNLDKGGVTNGPAVTDEEYKSSH